MGPTSGQDSYYSMNTQWALKDARWVPLPRSMPCGRGPGPSWPPPSGAGGRSRPAPCGRLWRSWWRFPGPDSPSGGHRPTGAGINARPPQTEAKAEEKTMEPRWHQWKDIHTEINESNQKCDWNILPIQYRKRSTPATETVISNRSFFLNAKRQLLNNSMAVLVSHVYPKHLRVDISATSRSWRVTVYFM